MLLRILLDNVGLYFSPACANLFQEGVVILAYSAMHCLLNRISTLFVFQLICYILKV